MPKLSHAKIYELCCNVKFLRTLLKDIGFKPMSGKADLLMENFCFPVMYKEQLEQVADMYGGHFFFRLEPMNEENISGGYSPMKRWIYLVVRRHGVVPFELIAKYFAHELAHRVQFKFQEDKAGKALDDKGWRDTQKLERAAERLAYFICVKYFSHICAWNHRSFKDYARSDDMAFLRKRYKRGKNYGKENNSKI